MPKTVKLRARVQEGLKKLSEASVCADEGQANALTAEGLGILSKVAFSTPVRERDPTGKQRPEAQKAERPTLRESDYIRGEKRPQEGSLLDRMGFDRSDLRE